MFEKINDDLINSLKSGDKFRLSVLRMLKSALQLEAINSKIEITKLEDDMVINVLKRQVKQRTDSMKEYSDLGKLETVEDLKKEIAIISEYLPAAASDEEIEKTINEAFEKLKPTSMKDMGQIMKFVTENIKNADMSKVSGIVKAKLSK